VVVGGNGGAWDDPAAWLGELHYQRVGPPKEALAIVEGELASGKTFIDDP